MTMVDRYIVFSLNRSLSFDEYEHDQMICLSYRHWTSVLFDKTSNSFNYRLRSCPFLCLCWKMSCVLCCSEIDQKFRETFLWLSRGQKTTIINDSTRSVYTELIIDQFKRSSSIHDFLLTIRTITSITGSQRILLFVLVDQSNYERDKQRDIEKERQIQKKRDEKRRKKNTPSKAL